MDHQELLKEFKNHVDWRFDRVEASLDKFGEKQDEARVRLARAEENIKSQKGAIRVMISVVTAALSAVAAWIGKQFIN